MWILWPWLWSKSKPATKCCFSPWKKEAIQICLYISLSGPIARLCNLNLASGIVPDLFKKAIIHLIYKGQGKNPSDPGSYRPIAILPANSKILEMIVRDNLLEWFEQTNFLPESQYGFIPGRSVDMALIIAQNDMINPILHGGVKKTPLADYCMLILGGCPEWTDFSWLCSFQY